MSWDLPQPRKPFYRRAWFWAPLVVLCLLGGTATLVVYRELDKWDHAAEAFDYSKLTEMESASIIYDREGQVLGRIFIQNRDQVPFEELSQDLLKAVVGGEDARFYSHNGVDYYGIARAAVKNYQAGRTRQGASTLTQQLARNTFSEDLRSGDRSYARKMLEIAVAKQIEKHLSKQQILDLYLNRVFFGSGFYGAEAAARGYFGKHAKEVDLSESAMLVGLLKSPNNLSPWRNRDACVEQRNYVLQRLLELKMINREDYDAALKEDLVIKNRRPIHQESYAAELVAQQVKKVVGDERSVVSEGYRIYTTIDSGLQKKAEETLREKLATVERHEGFEHQTYAQYDQLARAWRRKYASDGESAGPAPEPEYLQGSVVMLDNASGGILALVGGRDFAHSPYNRALSAHRPVGSAFLPFVYASAFESGMYPGTTLQDAVMDNRQVMIGGTQGILGEWGPERVDNRYEGTISARTALVKSKNAATVRLGMSIGKNMNESLAKLADLCKRSGIASDQRPFPATFLGSSEMTPMEMTLATSVFPDAGTRPTHPFIVQRIEEKNGRVLFEEKPERQRAIPATIAYEVHDCLAEVLDRGTADKTFTELGLKRYPLGGKTGTAYNFTDVWFLGYSSAVTCSVWAGFDKPRTTIYRGAFSNEIALPIWATLMKESFEKYKPKEIVPPKGIMKVEVCSSSGLLATPKCFETIENKETGEKLERPTTYSEMCTEAQAPRDPCDVHGDIRRLVRSDQPRRSSQWPAAIPVSQGSTTNTVVALQSATVLGKDPYNSIQAVSTVAAIRELSGKQAPMESSATIPTAPAADPNVKEIPVARAVPAGPMERSTVVDGTIQLERPQPLEF